MILNPKPNTLFRLYNHRLALFHAEKEHTTYWKQYWRNKSYITSLVQRGFTGDAGEFSGLFDKYLMPGQRVIEAGCGPAHLVAALTVRGCHAIGVDYEPEVIRFLNNLYPDLAVRQGNVLALKFPDEYFNAYISVGVVEHFPEGPLPALMEARRVLKKDGVILVSVPYLNPLRDEFLSYLSAEPPTWHKHDSLHFHQYYFSIKEFSVSLHDSGFHVREVYPYAVKAFLVREHPVFSRFWKSPFCRGRIKFFLLKFINSAPMWVRGRYAHMIMFVAHAV